MMTISGNPEPNKKPRLTLGWILIMLGVGSAMVLSLPLVKPIRSKNWSVTPCVILNSSLKTYTNNNDLIYAVNVSYEYQIDGQKFTGERYRFLSGSGNEYEAMANIVRALPTGKQTVCYVNPTDHHESVLERGLTVNRDTIVVFILPLLAGLLGVVLLVHQWGKGKKWRIPGPVLWGYLGILISATILGGFLGTNGINPDKVRGWWFYVSMPSLLIILSGYEFVHYFRKLKKSQAIVTGSQILHESSVEKKWFLSLVCIVLVGNFICYKFGFNSTTWPVFLIVLIFDVLFLLYLPVLFIFKAKPRLILRNGNLRAGEKLVLEWEFERADRIKILAFALQGWYKDYDRRDPEIFASYLILPATDDPQHIRYGTLTFNLPADLRPSHCDADGEVIWKIVAGITSGNRRVFTTKREYPVTISGAG